jgi:hypothetical protein
MRHPGDRAAPAPDEGEAVRLRPPAAWAETAAAQVVVVLSVRKAVGAGTAEEEGRALQRRTPKNVAGAVGGTRGETTVRTCVGGVVEESCAHMDAGQEPHP